MVALRAFYTIRLPPRRFNLLTRGASLTEKTQFISRNILHAPSGLHSPTGETDMIGKIREHGKTKNLIYRSPKHIPSQQQQNRRLTSNFHSIVTTIPIFHSGREETRDVLILHRSSDGRAARHHRSWTKKFRCGLRCPNKATKRETIRRGSQVSFFGWVIYQSVCRVKRSPINYVCSKEDIVRGVEKILPLLKSIPNVDKTRGSKKVEKFWTLLQCKPLSQH